MAFIDPYDQIGPSSMAMVEEIIARPDAALFVAEEDGRLIGMATIYILPNPCTGARRGLIEDFFIVERFRGQGRGTALFNEIKEYCRANGAAGMKLSSGNRLTGAHLFYEKLGGLTTQRFFRFDID